MLRLLTLSALLAFSSPLAARHISKPPALPAPKPHKLEIRPNPFDVETPNFAFANAIISGNITAVKECINQINQSANPQSEWREMFMVSEGGAGKGAGILELAVVSGSEAVLTAILENAKAYEPAREELLSLARWNGNCRLHEAIKRAASRNDAHLLKILLDVIPRPHEVNLGPAFDVAIAAGASDCVRVLASIGYWGGALSKAMELGKAEIVTILLKSKHADALMKSLPSVELIKLPNDLRLHDVVWAALTNEVWRWMDVAVRKKFPPTPPRRAKVREGALVSDASQLLLNSEVASWKKFRAESQSDKSNLLRFAYEFTIQNESDQVTWTGSLFHLAALYGRDEHIRELALELGPSIEPIMQCIEWDGQPATGLIGPACCAAPTKHSGKNIGWTPLRVAVHAGQLKAAAVLVELEGEHEAWRSSLLSGKPGLLETALRSPFYEAKMVELLVAGAAKYPVLRDRIFGVDVKMSPLGWAVAAQNKEAVRSLLAAADADPQMAAIVLRLGTKKENALSIAAGKGMSEMVQILLSSESYRRHIESEVRNRNIQVAQEEPARRYIVALLEHYFPAVPREDEASMRLKALGVLMLVMLSSASGHSM